MPVGILIVNRACASFTYIEVFQLVSNLFTCIPLRASCKSRGKNNSMRFLVLENIIQYPLVQSMGVLGPFILIAIHDF